MMQLTQGLRRSALLHAQRTATIFGDRRTSWGEFAREVSRLAGALRALDVQPGDRIAILALNSDRYFLAFYAIAWAGCVAVPFNTRWAPAEHQLAIADSRPTIIIVDATFAQQGRDFAEQGLTVIGLEEEVAHLIELTEPIEDQCGRGADLAAIFYTGGTTGRSKGVMLSHANLLTNFLLLHAVASYDPDTIFLHIPPMFHLADAVHVFGLTMIGATHVILPGFDPISTIEAIEQHGITAMVLVPTMIGMLCEALRTRSADMSGITRLTYGASPISAALLERALVAFPNARFCQAYGQTELSPCVTVLDHADHLAKLLRSAGQPLPCVDVKIVDAEMQEVGQGEVGEILARGPCVMLGYWRQPELTQETIVDGWLRTGDAGYIDANGYIYLVDRVKDMIISGGENIYSAEVENAILSHADILQCAVIGVPDPIWGERVLAVVQLRENTAPTEADIVAHCAPLIANYKRPKTIEFQYDPLPLSPVGKILKTELRHRFWQENSRRIG